MTILLWGMFAILTTSVLLLPARRFVVERDREKFRDEYRLFKLRAVKQRYPVLRNLTYSEIEELFDLDSIYDKI